MRLSMISVAIWVRATPSATTARLSTLRRFPRLPSTWPRVRNSHRHRRFLQLASLHHTLDTFSAKLLVKDVERQSSVAPGESTTDGFTLVNADASWSYGFNDSARLTLTAFARNLTDEVARNHASFVKDQVPLPGRNIGVRVRLDF